MAKANAISKTGREKRIRMSDDLLWGIHPVFEAIEQHPGRMSEIILQRDKRGGKWEEIIAKARLAKVKLTFVSSIKIIDEEGSSQVRHQGIVAKMSHIAMTPFAQFLEDYTNKVKQGEKPRVIVCDSLQDPHNLGAIIRSAHASGASGVLITREKSAPLGGTAAKSSAGAISHIDICGVTNLANALKDLKKAGAWVFGAVKDAEAQPIYTTDFEVPACIVVGSEGKGIRPLVRKQCDVLISIPMVGELDSLNSSVAAGVILFEALRQNQE